MNMIATFAGGNRPYRFTRDEYLRLSEAGVFHGKRVELIGGEIIEMAAQNNRHAQGVQALLDALTPLFGPNFWVRSQMTLDLSPHGVPDPDIAVIAGGWRTHPPGAIPTTALLVGEVSDTTLRDDQTYMMSLYAASGIQEYWILDVVGRQLEVYRDPTPDPSQQFGARYQSVTTCCVGDVTTPLALAGTTGGRVAVTDLLP
jgi:Uma2 family endonuclease